jgi:hypothetical protein
MAYLADNAWSHPKIADLTDRQFRMWIHGIAYSSGYLTKGVLTPGQQRTIGCDIRTRNALVKAAVWDDIDGETIRIHDWDDANSKRDERREKDRKRKRDARATSKGQTAGQSAGTSTGRTQGQSTLAAHVEGSEGSEGSEGTTKGFTPPNHPPHEQPLIKSITPNLREIA